MAKADIRLIALDATGKAASTFYTIEDIEGFGFKDNSVFYETAVVCSFQVRCQNQIFPLRVWFLRNAVPEDQWTAHAKKIAAELAMWTNEALNTF